MAHTTTVTAATAVATADRINAEFQAGTLTTVNGREPASRYGATVATAWQNGTVSVSVRGRAKGKLGEVYIKSGQTLHTA
jgi:hypothetical protein